MEVGTLVLPLVDNGSIEGWILLKKVRGIGNPEPLANEIDYIWVHLYKNVKQLAEKSSKWDYKKVSGKKGSELYAGMNRKTFGQFYYKIEKQIQTGNQGKFVLLNWCTPNDLAGCMKKADEISNRFSNGRLISILEGGYNLSENAAAAASHIEILNNFN